jgi:hypothetical protein
VQKAAAMVRQDDENVEDVEGNGGLALDGQSAALIVIEPRAFSQLLFEDADFLLEVCDNDLLVAVHPAGDANQEEGNVLLKQMFVMVPSRENLQFRPQQSSLTLLRS